MIEMEKLNEVIIQKIPEEELIIQAFNLRNLNENLIRYKIKNISYEKILELVKLIQDPFQQIYILIQCLDSKNYLREIMTTSIFGLKIKKSIGDIERNEINELLHLALNKVESDFQTVKIQASQFNELLTFLENFPDEHRNLSAVIFIIQLLEKTPIVNSEKKKLVSLDKFKNLIEKNSFEHLEYYLRFANSLIDKNIANHAYVYYLLKNVFFAQTTGPIKKILSEEPKVVEFTYEKKFRKFTERESIAFFLILHRLINACPNETRLETVKIVCDTFKDRHVLFPVCVNSGRLNLESRNKLIELHVWESKQGKTSIHFSKNTKYLSETIYLMAKNMLLSHCTANELLQTLIKSEDILIKLNKYIIKQNNLIEKLNCLLQIMSYFGSPCNRAFELTLNEIDYKLAEHTYYNLQYSDESKNDELDALIKIAIEFNVPNILIYLLNQTKISQDLEEYMLRHFLVQDSKIDFVIVKYANNTESLVKLFDAAVEVKLNTSAIGCAFAIIEKINNLKLLIPFKNTNVENLFDKAIVNDAFEIAAAVLAKAIALETKENLSEKIKKNPIFELSAQYAKLSKESPNFNFFKIKYDFLINCHRKQNDPSYGKYFFDRFFVSITTRRVKENTGKEKNFFEMQEIGDQKSFDSIKK